MVGPLVRLALGSPTSPGDDVKISWTLRRSPRFDHRVRDAIRGLKRAFGTDHENRELTLTLLHYTNLIRVLKVEAS